MLRIDLVGQTFNFLKVLRWVGKTGNNHQLYICECLRCGKETKPLSASHIKKVKSCGCLRDEMYEKGTRLKHGLTKRGDYDPIYSRLKGIIVRCNNPNNQKYKDYGARGITVWEHWEDLSLASINAFRNYILELYPNALELLSNGYEIDRINNDSGYQPGNLRIVSRKVNCRNMRGSKKYTFNGVHVLDTYDKHPNPQVSKSTFLSRLRLGWSLDKALNFPKRYKKPNLKRLESQ